MKTTAIFILFTLLLSGALSTANAWAYIDVAQSININDDNSLYWALIWDYTNGTQESATVGFIDEYTTLDYSIVNYGEVHVAYIYDAVGGRYAEALAIRDILL